MRDADLFGFFKWLREDHLTCLHTPAGADEMSQTIDKRLESLEGQMDYKST